MPEMDGLQAAKAIKEEFKEVKIIMLTQYGERRFVKKCQEIGAKGYLIKDCSKSKLIDTIRDVHNGGVHFIPGEDYNNGFPIPDLLKDVHLTCKEKEVLELIAEEKCNYEIATELKIEKTTVKTHKRRMLWKTGAKTITGLVVWAFRKRIIK